MTIVQTMIGALAARNNLRVKNAWQPVKEKMFIRVLYAKVTFANKFLLSLKIFIINRNKFQFGFYNIYPEIINMCQDNVKHGKKLYR